MCVFSCILDMFDEYILDTSDDVHIYDKRVCASIYLRYIR